MYLKWMSIDSKWGDCIALLGLVNMLDAHLAHLGHKRQSLAPMNSQDGNETIQNCHPCQAVTTKSTEPLHMNKLPSAP